jgi:predicted AlkP superfamily pyrophosphatase or phosphodiesterase
MAMRQTLVLDVVGLTPKLLPFAPRLSALAKKGAMRPLRTITPALTCSVQSTFTTGLAPSGHGCVANGWYYRELADVALWKQANPLVTGEKIWDAAKRRNPAFTCAKLFWWYNMYSTADYAVTPRPQYPADGRKLPDVHSHPADLRDELQGRLGTFPLFNFWGPRADLSSSSWILKASEHVFETREPTLTLVYVPHLDYDLQRFGPEFPGVEKQVKAVDDACAPLIAKAEKKGAAVIVLSEYGITRVTGAVHINRALRKAGLLAVRQETMGEQLDAGASEAFAVADHQVAHIYVRRPERIAEVAALVRGLDGVEAVWGAAEKKANGLDHSRAGELVAVSRADRWFTYYFWLDDDRAPDYARTVDIHRKPGYDPVELFINPEIALPMVKVGWTLAKRKMGFRSLLDVVSLDASLVKGSHGRITDSPNDGPLFITSEPDLLPPGETVEATAVKPTVLRHIFGAASS